MVVLEDGQDILPLESDNEPLPDVRFESVWVRQWSVHVRAFEGGRLRSDLDRAVHFPAESEGESGDEQCASKGDPDQ